MKQLFSKNNKDKILSRSNSKVPLIVLVEIALGIVFSVSSFLLFVKIAEEVLEKETYLLDSVLSQAIYSLRTPLLTEIMQVITVLGGEFIVVASVLIAVFFIWKKKKREVMLFSFTILMGYILNSAIKYLLKVPRPDIDPIYIAHFYSFPSGHAMNSFIFYAITAYFFFHFTQNKTTSAIICLLAAILIVLIGFSRVYLGVHYPSDILAGFIAGFWWVITVIVIDKTLRLYRTFRRHT